MKQEKGFTLIEILISLTILSLIMGVIMGGFRLGTRSWQAGEKRMEEQQRMRCVFDILIQDIKSCMRIRKPVKKDDRNQANWAVVFLGGEKKLTFITTASGIDRQLKKGNLRLVSYSLSEDEDKPGLLMQESPWLYQDPFGLEDTDMGDIGDDTLEPRSYIYSLYPDVVEIRLEYYGKKAPHGEVVDKGAEPEWYDDWNLLEDVQSGEGYLTELPEKLRLTVKRQRKSGKGEEDSLMSTSFEIPIIIGERRETAI